MSKLSYLKEKVFEFLREADLTEQQQMDLNPASTAPGLWPDTIFQILQIHSIEHAKMKCKHDGTTALITSLTTHRTNGTIPPSLETYFKNKYLKEDEAAFRAAMILASTNKEIAQLTARNTTLLALYNDRYLSTTRALQPFAAGGILIDNVFMALILDFLTSHTIAEFIHKQIKDTAKKATKQERFNLRKETDAQPIAITKRQLTSMQTTMKALQSQVATLKIKNQGKAKGAKPQVQSSAPKQVKRKSNGKDGSKPKSTANTKRSRGKNGK
jgi:hypothetical protein